MILRTVLLSALCFTAVSVLPACQQAPASNNSETQAPAFQSDKLEVTVVGTGPDVILIPGLASNASVWDSVVDALSDQYTFHIVQVAGFGGAQPRGNAGRTDILDGLTLDLSSYVEYLGTHPAIIGHSLGGLLTIKTGLSSENTVSGLMIVDVLPYFSVLMDPAATTESIAPIAAMMRAQMLSQTDEVFAASQADALKALTKSDEHRALALSWSVGSDRATMAQAMSEVLVTDLRDDVSQLDMPVTVIYARDPATPNMDAIDQLYASDYAPVPDLKLVTIENTFHFIMFDQPGALNQAIETFLSDLDL